MSENLVRVGGGLAAVLGGLLGVIASLMALVFLLPLALTQTPNESPSSGIITLTGLLLILAWVLVLGGLIGLHASQQQITRPKGEVGFVMALVGTVLIVSLLCIQTFYIPITGASDIERVVRLVAGGVVLFASAGWFLFGWDTYMARIYPRPAAMLLMVGAAINAFIHLTGGEFIVMSAAIAWLGFLLLRGKVDQSRSLRV
jgi:hypothetical protein